MGLMTGHSSLTELDLSHTQACDDGAEALAAAIGHKAASLRVLRVDSCGIGPKGGVCIAQALAVAQTLTDLSLSSNPLGEEAGVRIGDALQDNMNLVRLFLSQCEL